MKSVAASILLLIFLVACGENSTTEKVVEERTSVVSLVSDLPACDSFNEGEQILVLGESSVRICAGGKWYAAIADTVYEEPAKISCSAEKLPDGSGIKVLCEGDSIGVILNGEKGADWL